MKFVIHCYDYVIITERYYNYFAWDKNSNIKDKSELIEKANKQCNFYD